MNKFSFITRMPNEPGALLRAAEIVKRYGGNINRIHYDQRIDPATVFFEVTTTSDAYKQMLSDLAAIGYLQTSLKPSSFLKFYIYLPHRPGTLFEFLTQTTSAKANIAFVDFDDSGQHHDRMMMSLSAEDSSRVDDLLNALKLHYRLGIIEYDTTGKRLDETVFYIWFAQQLRELLGEAEEQFLMLFLQDINHIVQELVNHGKDPKKIFESVLATGKSLKITSEAGFYADVQKVQVTPMLTLYCFQLPCGGNIFLFNTPEELVMVDTGFGIYHKSVMQLFAHYGFGDWSRLHRIIVTHGDADHAGAAGFFNTTAYMHSESLNVITKANRAYGSRVEPSILEAVYTKLISEFSHFSIPHSVELFKEKNGSMRDIFPVIGRMTIGNLDFEVLEGLGGHVIGQIYLFCPAQGLLFTADTVINFDSLTDERKAYNTLAVDLVTSVNVDSEIASKERKALLSLARHMDSVLSPKGKRCLICGGHGAISILEGNTLIPFGPIERYKKSIT